MHLSRYRTKFVIAGLDPAIHQNDGIVCSLMDARAFAAPKGRRYPLLDSFGPAGGSRLRQ
jgi:hypothetical protein